MSCDESRKAGQSRGGGPRAAPWGFSVVTTLCAGAGAEPVADLGPEAFPGAAAGHEADVARVEDEELLVLAADEVHRGLGLREGADMVLLASDVQERNLYLREVHAA